MIPILPQQDTAESVVLVNENNQEVGVMDKQEAHVKGLLHRAFSIFIFNNEGQLLLQQRALHKYHSGGLWTNTCCSHPKPGELTLDAAHRRLQEEMGFDCELTEKFSFVYKAEFENGLTEHELDFIYTGTYNANPLLNFAEANCYKWMSLEEVKTDMHVNPNKYTAWFKIIFDRYLNMVK